MKAIFQSHLMRIITMTMFALMTCVGISHAVLTINVSQGIVNKPEVAIVPFSGDNVHNDNVPDGLTAVVKADLQNSGMVKVFQGKLPQQPSNAAQMKWAGWSSEYILLGRVEPTGSTYRVSFELVDRRQQQVVAARAFNNIQPTQFRLVAHNISNFVYEQMTGNKGYFTSKIAYINAINPYDRFKSVYQLIVADYDGYNPQTLLQQQRNPIAMPTWSADGKRIAYVSYHNGGMAIYTIDVTTGQFKVISNRSGINNAPAFSPNGQNLALALSPDANESTNIYVQNLSNGQLSQPLSLNGINTAPTYSPDGKTIAFVSDRSGQPLIYTIASDARYPTSALLTNAPHQALDPEYTPDGKNLVFMYQRARGAGMQIAVMDIDRKVITPITNGRSDASPTVSPDGSMVMYVKNSDRPSASLAMVSLDGSVQVDISVHTQGVISAPTWSAGF